MKFYPYCDYHSKIGIKITVVITEDSDAQKMYNWKSHIIENMIIVSLNTHLNVRSIW